MCLLHYLYLLPCLNNIYNQNMVNLRDRDNLRRKDKRPVPKVSFVRRFDCIYISSLPSLQVRKGSAVNEFLGWLIEIMAEVGTRSSMTSNHGRGHAHHHHIHRRHNMWPLIPDPFLHHSCTLPPTTTITQWKQ